MGDNAWDLAQDRQARSSSSPSCRSRIGSDVPMFELEAAVDAADIAPTELSMILDEEVRKVSERRLRHRSKSPAVDSIRQVGRTIFEKVGLLKKRIDVPVVDTAKEPEVPWTDLAECCERPLTFTSDTQPLLFSVPQRNVESLLSPAPLLSANEKCAYLFRGDSFNAPLETVPEEAERVHVYDPFCPVHGSRRRLHRSGRPLLKDLDSCHLTSIDSVEMTEPPATILLSQAYAAKLIRKRRRAQLSGAEKFRREKAKRKIKVNLWIVSLAFLFLFTAFHGLQNLQTSVNGQLGADTLCAFYISIAISSLFVPSFMLNRLGCKLTLITSSAIYMIFMLANFLPKYYSLIPAALLAGCAGSCLWAAKCVYISESGVRYAKLNIEAHNVVIVRFFGYFFMIMNLGQVIGNVLSSLILTAAVGYETPRDQVETTCGHHYPQNWSHLSERAMANLQRPPQSAYLAVCAVYFCCTIVALMIVLMFLNSLRKDEYARRKAPVFSLEVMKTTMNNLTRPGPLLLIPITIFNGLEQAFVVALYTKAYVGCGLGISQIGFVMTSFGVADASCSLVFGPLMKLFGRMPLFVFGAVINLLMIMTLMIWPLNPGDTALFYAIAGVWGMADGVWNTQINGFWVALSKGNLDTAFANYRFWESSGFAAGLFLTRFTSISEFLIVSLTVLLIGVTCYLGVEFYDEISAYVKQMLGVCMVGVAGAEKRRRGSKGRSSMETSLISKTSIPPTQPQQIHVTLGIKRTLSNSHQISSTSGHI